MAKHNVKCKYCGEIFDANQEEYVKIGNRYVHKKCFDSGSPQMKEEQDKNKFFKYVKQLFGEDFNYIVTQKLAKRFITENGYTYSGMYKTLVWFYEVEHHSVDKGNGSIGIIPYAYNNARNYYYKLFLAQEANKSKDISQYKPTIREITIPKPTVYVKPTKIFNLEE